MTPLLGAVFPAGLLVCVLIPGAWYHQINFAAKRRLCLGLQTLSLFSGVGLTVIGGSAGPTSNSTRNTSNGLVWTTADEEWGPAASLLSRDGDDGGGVQGHSSTTVAALQVVLIFSFTFGIGIAYYIPLHASSVRLAPQDAGLCNSTLDGVGCGARFPTEFYTRGYHWIPRMFAGSVFAGSEH
jgi:hypothetical protein